MKRVFIIFPFVVSFFCMCNTPSITVPAGFVKVEIPNKGDDRWMILNHCSHEYGVKIIDKKLYIQETQEVDTCTFKIAGGTLVAIDHGEFGGELTFHPSDHPDSSILIKAGNVKYIFPFNQMIYFLEGIAHGDRSAGALYQLNRTNNKFTYSQILDLNDAPQAYAIDGDNILLATYENLYIIKNSQEELVFSKTFWASLYPNSIAVENDSSLFIGMRGGVARLNLKRKVVEFYQSRKCVVLDDNASEMKVESVMVPDLVEVGARPDPDKNFLSIWSQMQIAVQEGNRQKMAVLTCDSLFYADTLISSHDFFSKELDTIAFRFLTPENSSKFVYQASNMFSKHNYQFLKVRQDSIGEYFKIREMGMILKEHKQLVGNVDYDFAETNDGYKLYRVSISEN